MADPIAENQAEEENERPYDASDPQAVNLARKKSSRRTADRLEMVKAMMELPRGREWMYNLLDSCFIFGNPFVPGQPDSTAFNLGMANVGKRILQDINTAAPDQYMLMLKEAKGKTT